MPGAIHLHTLNCNLLPTTDQHSFNSTYIAIAMYSPVTFSALSLLVSMQTLNKKPAAKPRGENYHVQLEKVVKMKVVVIVLFCS